ncbi:MAG: pyridoxal phosphate-dependent aminotransferase [Gemmatimonadales bacterium]|nr:MAG: pyridoxal phosphate-dependent aminotransferase [Gemmatimonadales bacterium]
MEFSSNVSRLSPSATIAVSTLARTLRAEGRDIVNLSAGEPDFPTPEWIADAAVQAIRDGETRYTPAPGIPELRAAVAEDAARDAVPGWAPEASQVVVTSGAKQALFNAIFALFGPGDEVLVATPYWTSYPQMVGLAGADAVPVQGPAERDFRLDAGTLEAARTRRTRGLILCSPSNPTGSVYDAGEIEAVTRWAKEHGIVVISDEIYRHISFVTEPGTRAPGLMGVDPVHVGPHVVVDGVSKAYAMTGWRIGWAIASGEVAGKLSALQSHTTSNAATPSQHAALAALRERSRADAAIREMVVAFRRRRDLVVEGFRTRLPHLELVEPQGAFYLFVRIDSEFGGEVTGSQAWCSAVLEETGVAMVPGAAFGDDRWARLSYATSDDRLEEAVRRLAEGRTRTGPATPGGAR